MYLGPLSLTEALCVISNFTRAASSYEIIALEKHIALIIIGVVYEGIMIDTVDNEVKLYLKR